MNYQETLDYLFHALPMFQRIGAAAFKKDLGPTLQLCKHLGDPQDRFKSIHVGGTNGKGSTSHCLASVLQAQGYKVGLYTSPHLKSFTERIRINGQPISEEAVVDFVRDNMEFMETIKPSFFEMTVALAFDYFAKERVDVAVIEVGMGGRLDSTNVIRPIMSIITNIGYDHMEFLGDTLQEIAVEKAGIIKSGIPIIIGTSQPETEEVFVKTAAEREAPIYFADREVKVRRGTSSGQVQTVPYVWEYELVQSEIHLGLTGDYQLANLPAILLACRLLPAWGFPLDESAITRGLREVVTSTGLKGRWQRMCENPLTICDTGHNVDAFELIVRQLRQISYRRLWMVMGMVKDKDAGSVLALLPKDASYVFCQASIPRAMPAAELAMHARGFGLNGKVVEDVNEALEWATKSAHSEDLIFVGGSTFVVAELSEL
ncbi:Dihydrofolate synthase [Lunatimonas lonarensis]|uniref:Dihydrofolate synthase/folylpolyglutamate synthase n=1 Tax=Lunatimonas lonarensis TaxID=1232681 RepID=R7ZRP3_9BACT|nr:folylpolyglutamate synthase/dihydrofolate synthase family protein [Lunatimonas lonarensis]EON76718.1 Dihydrofolate synthase [Lunatimonas lonarensis]